MAKMIFHIPFSIDPNRHSASQIRPKKMVEAFQSTGYEVFVIWGNNKQRKIKFNELKKKVWAGEKFEFLYSESSTMPQMLTEEHHLPSSPLLDIGIFRFVKSQGIPIGLFYRDIHWKFSQYKKETTFIKRTVASFFYEVDLWIYRYLVDVLFLPSKAMASHLPAFIQKKDIVELPPGHDILPGFNRIYSGNKKCLYVGGIKPPLYDLTALSNISIDIPINIVCRKDEWVSVGQYYPWAKNNNIRIHHGTGEDLSKHYMDSDLFLLIWKPNSYLNFAMPMKIFEAIGFKIPVITKAGTLAAEFVKENNIGWVYTDENDLNEIINSISLDYQEKLRNIKAISENHHWNNRAKEVKKKLISINENFNRNRS